MFSDQNARLWMAIRFFNSASFILPVWLLFNIDVLGLNYTQAFVLGTAASGLSMLFEIPTGSWADRHGRKLAFNIGTILTVLGILPLLFTNNFWVLLGFSLFAALGYALGSGSLQPLVKISLSRNGLDQHLAKVLSYSTAISFLARILAVLIGAWLYSIDPYYVIYAWIASKVIVIALAQRMNEFGESGQVSDTNAEHISQTWSSIRRNPMILTFIIYMVIFSLSAESLFKLIQPLLENASLEVRWFGLAYGLYSGLSMSGSLLAGRLGSAVKPSLIAVAMMTAGVISIALSPYASGWLVIAALAPSALAFGLVIPVNDNLIQTRIRTELQSTALSIARLSRRCAGLIGALVFGALLDVWTVRTTAHVMAAVSILLLVVMVYDYWTRSRKLA